MKYPIHKDFEILTAVTPPSNRWAIPFFNMLLSKMAKKSIKEYNLQFDTYTVKQDGFKFKVFVFNPTAKDCMLYIHGGGFILKASAHHYFLAKKYADELNCTVVMIDYSLSPKRKHPYALHECETAVKWIKEHLKHEKFYVGGDSAGGYISLWLALTSKELPIDKLLLVYPFLDETLSSEANAKYTDTPLWNSALSRKVAGLLYNKKKPLPNVLNEVRKVESLPPTYLENAEFDSLHDDPIMLYNILKEKNSPVELYETKGTIHGYDMMLTSEIAQKAIEKRVKFLKR